ncbi:hypothetical protein [Microbacterium sp. PRC9]|uniref:hypothetical protein n=1 Tax=Microbacterium sp. PRC9 TaxID=2962591 RepID=UPI002881D873|nr:hypothetical protein [Microbacterium sp. PRC9]MDT0142785.1 hypothetical protein [Microbacterium sp. PRC9]
MKKILAAIGIVAALGLTACAAPSLYDQAWENCTTFYASAFPEEWTKNHPPESECKYEREDKGESFSEFWTDPDQYKAYQDELVEMVEGFTD